jgi:uncharacterized protein YjbI with pentapeptide repeats
LFQKLRRFWKDHWPIFALLATALVIAVTGILRIWRSWERPFWDWLELLIIPVLLGLGGIWFNNQARKSEQALAREERENDREIAADRAREDALQRYIDRMQELILDKGLRRSEKDEEIRNVTRARTLTVVRTLDGNRKGHVVRFLYESNLRGKELRQGSEEGQVIEAIVDLQDADLHGVNLRDAYLKGADLIKTNLSGANLYGTYLADAGLLEANMAGANLCDADLSGADMFRAILSYANLIGAFVPDADLQNSDLRYADL